MARAALVLDASVGVKWFASTGEDNLIEALDIRRAHIEGKAFIAVPDLFYYEVANALTYKKALPLDEIELAIASLFDVSLQSEILEAELARDSVKLARRLGLTVYDACYAVIAAKKSCPLVTANPRHQGKARQLGCRVIPLKDWKGNDFSFNL